MRFKFRLLKQFFKVRQIWNGAVKKENHMSEPKTYARRLVKGSAIVFTALVASQIVAFLLRMLLARSLSVAEYGLFYAVFVFISFLLLFGNLGFGDSLIKHVPEFEAKKQFDKIKSSMAFALIFFVILSFSIVALIFIFSSEIALTIFGDRAAVPILQILAIWFFIYLTIFFIPLCVFQGFQNMPAYASLQFFNGLLVLLSAFLLVGYFGMGVQGASLAYLLAMLIIGILGFVILRHGYPHVFRARISITKPLVKKLSLFALPVFLAGIASLVITYTDTLMIAVFRTLPEVGYYQAAQPTARLLWYFPGALTTVLFPMVSELWAKKKKKLVSSALHFLTKFSFVLIIPVALVFITFPKILISLLFGPAYLAGATVLQILGVTAIVYIPFLILSRTMAGIGKPIVVAKVVALMAGLNLAGNLVLIPAYGIEGAAAATLISFLLGMGLIFYYARKFIEFTVPSSSLLKTTIGGALTLLLIFGLKYVVVLPPWPEAFAVMVPSLLFYGTWILMTKAITKDDLKLIKEIVPIPGWLARIAGRLVKD